MGGKQQRSTGKNGWKPKKKVKGKNGWETNKEVETKNSGRPKGE